MIFVFYSDDVPHCTITTHGLKDSPYHGKQSSLAKSWRPWGVDKLPKLNPLSLNPIKGRRTYSHEIQPKIKSMVLIYSLDLLQTQGVLYQELQSLNKLLIQ